MNNYKVGQGFGTHHYHCSFSNHKKQILVVDYRRYAYCCNQLAIKRGLWQVCGFYHRLSIPWKLRTRLSFITGLLALTAALSQYLHDYRQLSTLSQIFVNEKTMKTIVHRPTDSSWDILIARFTLTELCGWRNNGADYPPIYGQQLRHIDCKVHSGWTLRSKEWWDGRW